MKESIERKVKRGASWMDTVFPGWEKKVRLKNVDLELHGFCVLGQTFSQDVSEKLCAQGKFRFTHGFHLENKDFKRSNWIKLSSIWAFEAEKRKLKGE